MRRIPVVIFILISLMLLSATGRLPARSFMANAQDETLTLPSVFTPRPPNIDGQLRSGEWDAATIEPFTFFMLDLNTGQDTRFIPADLYLMNDQTNLYLGLRILGVPYNNPGIAGSGFDFLLLLFDSDNDGVLEENEDRKFLLSIQPNIESAQRGAYFDFHVPGDPEVEDGADLHLDGLGRLVHSNVQGIGDYTAEFALPLNSGDPQDIRTAPGGQLRFNLLLLTGVDAVIEGGGLFDLAFGGEPGEDSSGWGLIQLQSGQSPPDPEPQLSGTIAFVSGEFEEGRQVYVMNADGTDVQARTQGDQAVGAPALSPDRQMIVYTVTSRDEADKDGDGDVTEEIPETREIFSLNTSRGRARRLTNNRVADDHPVFSPDGQTIVFARDGNIWMMNASGGGEHQLTNLGADGDPTWAPDGRIVFITGRWGSIDIAVMQADGSHVTRITNNERGSLAPRVSPDGQWVTFFRYDGPGSIFNFTFDLFFHPWNIYRIRLDGTDEQRLTSDGLFNSLPVFAPDGRGILYQKNLDILSGYTVLHYLDLQTGEDRRVLNLSRVEGFDWR